MLQRRILAMALLILTGGIVQIPAAGATNYTVNNVPSARYRPHGTGRGGSQLHYNARTQRQLRRYYDRGHRGYYNQNYNWGGRRLNYQLIR